MSPSILIIGAGMAGIAAARALRHAGVDVMLVDKGRAVGGRMATRRIGEATFDHGAQHVSVRTEAFEHEIEGLVQNGTAGVWFRSESVRHPERGIESRYAGVGGMRCIPEALAEGLTVSTGVAVDRLRIDAGAVTAFAAGTLVASAGAAILTPPLPQTRALLAASNVDRSDAVASLGRVEYDATLAVMVVLDAPADLPDGHRAFDGGPVGWLADNQAKGVSAVPALTIHSSADFARTHLETEPRSWMTELVAAARPFHRGSVVDAVAHRWRFAQPRTTLASGAIAIDAPVPVVLAGEVFSGARVEGAYTSGRAAAELVLERIS